MCVIPKLLMTIQIDTKYGRKQKCYTQNSKNTHSNISALKRQKIRISSLDVDVKNNALMHLCGLARVSTAPEVK